jgi:hypothetical protein
VNRKEFLSQCVNHIARKIVEAKLPDGRTPRGVAEKLLQEGRSVFPTMTMNMINYAVKKLMVGGTKPKLKKSTVMMGQQTCVSSLTKDTASSNTMNDSEAVGALMMLNLSSRSGECSCNESREDESREDISIRSAIRNSNNSTDTLNFFGKSNEPS